MPDHDQSRPPLQPPLVYFTLTNGPQDPEAPGFRLELPEGDCTVTFTPNIPKAHNA